jgi:vanillate O-demethylase ferredoxin subunit
MQLRIRSITYLAEAVTGFELVDPRGRDLPRFEAGAHVAVTLGGGLCRRYSLYNDPAERRRYCIAVLRQPDSRGGSRYLHDTARVGDLLDVSLPRNSLALAEDARRHVLVAGGIGIAPLLSLTAELRRRRASFVLYYCARSRERAAFRDELAMLAAEGRVRFYHDGRSEARDRAIAAAFGDAAAGTQLYCCGPPRLLAAAQTASRAWPPATVQCESFATPAEGEADAAPADGPFRVRLAQSGGEYPVAATESIAEALRHRGIAVNTRCELGYCGACLTRFVEGEPDHRDQLLGDTARQRYLLICCSRSKTPVLTLDL